MSTKTRRLTESAMLLAVAIVLELVSKMFIPELPFGGQVTLVSMLPVVLISYRHGVKWGLVAGVGYALLEMALGAKTVAAAFQPGYFGDGTMIVNALIMCLLDYLVAFTVLGLGGLLRDRVRSAGASLAVGAVVALGARYVAHIASATSCFPAGRSGFSPRRASRPGVLRWWKRCLQSCWAWCIPWFTTACTWCRSCCSPPWLLCSLPRSPVS